MKPGSVRTAETQAHRHGNGLEVRDVRAAIYGTRYLVDRNAGHAPSRVSIGKAPSSVWNGPRVVLGGAPVLRRNKPAG